MSVLGSVTQALPKAKTALFTACRFGTVVYVGVLKPMPRDQAMYLGFSAAVRRLKNLTVQERDQMHQYASGLLTGRTELPHGMTVQLACQVQGILAAESSYYRGMHPVLARTRTAA